MRVFRLAWCLAASSLCAIPDAGAETPGRWSGPFGGQFHANFTVATDYAQSGISNSENKPVFQMGVDWHSPYLLDDGPPLRVYVAGQGTTVSFPEAGPGVEIQVSGGAKLGLLNRKLTLDVGYIRYLYPDYAADLGFEYGEIALRADYDFGPFTVSGRLRYSPDFIAHAGQAWNKRALVSVPLPFLALPDGMRMKAYGSLGNVWIEKPDVLELPSNDFWYWQIGVVTSVWGLDITIAYTDTNIEASGCGFTRACEGRLFASITKVF